MLPGIIFFTVNTLAVRAIALAFSACDGWEVTLFRGIAGSAVVVVLSSRSGHLSLKPLLDRPKVIALGILGTIGVLFFDETLGVVELSGAALTLIATMMVNPRTSKLPSKKLTIQKTK